MDVELSEQWLSEETGISRSALKETREHRLSADDWRKGARGQIVWELSGLDRASAEFPELAGVLEKITGGAEAAERALTGLEPVEAVVVRKFGNPRIIEAERPTGERIRVRVRESRNFITKMKIMVRPPKVAGTPWLLEGRCPRWPGRF